MASIERTAYPRFKRFMTVRELDVFYTPQPDEIVWAGEAAGSDEHLLASTSVSRARALPRSPAPGSPGRADWTVAGAAERSAGRLAAASAGPAAAPVATSSSTWPVPRGGGRSTARGRIWFRVLRKRYSADECTNEVTEMDVTALVTAIIGATTGVAGMVTAVISIRIARRSATAGDVTAIATKTATEVAQKQLAIERDRHHHELEQRHEDAAPALAGHVVKNRVESVQPLALAMILGGPPVIPVQRKRPLPRPGRAARRPHDARQVTASGNYVGKTTSPN